MKKSQLPRPSESELFTLFEHIKHAISQANYTLVLCLLLKPTHTTESRANRKI